MPRFHKTLLLPGNEITAMAEHVAEGQIEDQPPSMVLGGPYEVAYDNQFKMRVRVINSEPPSIVAQLEDHGGHIVLTMDGIDGDLDQDYLFEYGQDTYEMTIVRAANTVLLDEEVEVYLEQGGVRCPFCGSDDLHTGRMQTDAGIAWQRVECCSCEARWKDQYRLTGISREEGDWEPPQVNVARSGG